MWVTWTGIFASRPMRTIFVDRLPEITVLAAHVADVASAVARRFPGEFDDFLARGIDARVVLEAGGEAERTCFHAVFHAQAHLLDFLAVARRR